MVAKDWYRHRDTGDLAYLVEDGKIKLNREGEEPRRFKPEEWIVIDEHRPLAPAHLAEICFNADAKLCFFLGLRENARKEWINLTGDQKRRWMEKGPSAESAPWRAALWKAIRESLGGLAQ